MAWQFGDGFDLYALPADMANGYWDAASSGFGVVSLQTGRFSGSRALQLNTSFSLIKTSAVNDALHHIVVSILQVGAITGSTLGGYFQLSDGATNQVCVVFRSDGAILLTSATAAGTVLATYTGAVTANNTWFAFEIEVFISNAAGYMNVRKNGNSVNDFTSATNLNTRPGANSYANKLTIAMNAAIAGGNHQIDDLYWRSDASSVPWMGDIRCYTRMPASDASTQFSRTPASNTQTPAAASTTGAITAGTARYTTFTAAYDGTIGSAAVSFGTGYTGNLKCSIFADASGVPGTVLGSASVVVNPAAGSNAITFGSPVAVTKSAVYWVGFDSDTSSGTWSVAAGTTGKSSTTAYASFPGASPTTIAAAAIVCSLTITTSSNATVVNEAQQDGTTSYVYDSTPGDQDLYGIAAIASTPVTTLAVTTRAYMQKSDAGTRTAAVQLKSGSTTVASPTLTLTTSGWQWAWRTDTTDPATGAAWTAAAVNNVQVGPKTIA